MADKTGPSAGDDLATVLQAQGRNDEAEQAARQALATLQKNFKHWQIADAESVLGGTLMVLMIVRPTWFRWLSLLFFGYTILILALTA